MILVGYIIIGGSPNRLPFIINFLLKSEHQQIGRPAPGMPWAPCAENNRISRFRSSRAGFAEKAHIPSLSASGKLDFNKAAPGSITIY